MAVDDLLIERLLRVIDEGRRTATYKLALLLGLIDAVAVSPGEITLPTRLIAEQVVQIYFPQTRAYVDTGGAVHQPRQISVKKSPVLDAIGLFRAEAETIGVRNGLQAANELPQSHRRTLDVVEDTFVRYPIPLMQVVGSEVIPFLYEVDWPEGASLASLRKQSLDRVRLMPGVSERLVVLGPMLRPLIELHWTADVARWSRLGLEDESLRSHLFGRERASFPKKLVGGLRSLQDGDCFYCGEPLGQKVQVDHFLAWSRWPNDAIENLVLADRCNGDKSDHLAATDHLARWRLRLASRAGELEEVAQDGRWLSSADRSWSLAQSTYSAVVPGTPLWLRGKEFEMAGATSW